MAKFGKFEAVVAAYLTGAQASAMGDLLRMHAAEIDELAARVQRGAKGLTDRLSSFADAATEAGPWIRGLGVGNATPVRSSAADCLEDDMAKLDARRQVFCQTWAAWSGEAFSATAKRVAA